MDPSFNELSLLEETLTKITQAPGVQGVGEQFTGLDSFAILLLLVIVLVFAIILVVELKTRDIPAASSNR